MGDALEKAREARRAKVEAGVKLQRLDPLEKARRRPSSLRAAVNAKCWECMGAGGDPGCKRAIRECTASACPLYPVRPYQRKASA